MSTPTSARVNIAGMTATGGSVHEKICLTNSIVADYYNYHTVELAKSYFMQKFVIHILE